MNRYLNILSKFLKDHYIELESGSDKVSNYMDGLVVWIISLSTGSIALIFASIDKIEFVVIDSIKFALISFVLSIVLGVIGRLLSLISSYLSYNMTSEFLMSIRTLDLPNVQRRLKGDETAEQIHQYLVIDYNLSFPEILKNRDIINKSTVDDYNKQIRKFYVDLSENHKKDYKSALDSLNEILTQCFGLNKNFFYKQPSKKKNNRIKGIIMRLSTKGSIVLITCSLLSFLISIISVSIRFLCFYNQ